jgi:hypothetical protein
MADTFDGALLRSRGNRFDRSSDWFATLTKPTSKANSKVAVPFKNSRNFARETDRPAGRSG